MKGVILGLPGPWADDNLEAADHYTTKIGGLPDWPFPESSLNPDVLECHSCKGKLCLISQVYAPISDSNVKIEERVIYVFGCPNPPCGSLRAIRVQKPGNSAESEAAPSGVSSSTCEVKSSSDLNSFDAKLESDDDDDDNDDDGDDLNMEELGRALFEAASLASKPIERDAKKKSNAETNTKQLSLNHEIRKLDATTIALPCFYLYCQEDKSYQDSSDPLLSVKEAQFYKDKDRHHNDVLQEENWEEEGYEYDKALNADRVYLKFKKRLDKFPEQCFRYSFGGNPLLAIGDVGDLVTCCLCGEPKLYEMQLMSPLVYFLQEGTTIRGQRDLLENWDWMTLIVYTCSKACFQKLDGGTADWHGWTVVEETVIAQFEKPLTESSQLGLVLEDDQSLIAHNHDEEQVTNALSVLPRHEDSNKSNNFVM